MKTALLVIATGTKYHQYIKPLFESADRYFVSHAKFLWSEAPFDDSRVVRFECKDEGFPNATLMRYHKFYSQAAILSSFDQLFYCDVDMQFVAPVDERDIFSTGITATLHPGFTVERFDRSGCFVSTNGTPERANPQSKAFIPYKTKNRYFCGGFNGGNSSAFLSMSDAIRKNVDWDKENFGLGYAPVWHDESYLNRYLYDNPPVKILTPSFCYPEDYDGGYGWTSDLFPPVLVALNKRKSR